MSDGLEPVTIFTTFDAWEAHLARHTLERAGIEAFVADEHVVGVNWLYANALGGVKLRVRARDAEEAIRILEELRRED